MSGWEGARPARGPGTTAAQGRWCGEGCSGVGLTVCEGSLLLGWGRRAVTHGNEHRG